MSTPDTKPNARWAARLFALPSLLGRASPGPWTSAPYIARPGPTIVNAANVIPFVVVCDFLRYAKSRSGPGLTTEPRGKGERPLGSSQKKRGQTQRWGGGILRLRQPRQTLPPPLLRNPRAGLSSLDRPIWGHIGPRGREDGRDGGGAQKGMQNRSHREIFSLSRFVPCPCPSCHVVVPFGFAAGACLFVRLCVGMCARAFVCAYAGESAKLSD